MRKDTSKENMEEMLHLLDKLEKVKPNKELFQKIEARIQRQKQDTIPLNWLRIAAIAFVCFISVEVYYMTNTSSTDNELNNMVSTIDNTLYDE